MTLQTERTKILVIDDERLIRLMLNAKLKQIGYTAVCVASIPEAFAQLNDGGYKQFKAIITDIVMGDMDGFVFRDILRGMDESMPVFFMTAMDPEEGSGFLKRIMEDSYSFYLPKSIKPDLLMKRIQKIVYARNIEDIIKERENEVSESMTLASNLQRHMLPPRVKITDTDFYLTWWMPKDMVSGDLFEIIPIKDGGHVFIVGDIQGHGTSASLAMMAIQSFLKQLPTIIDMEQVTPEQIANAMQKFFRNSLGAFTYMTAIICIYRPSIKEVEWISCGAPDLCIEDPINPDMGEINPEKRGGLPIGLMSDTVYSSNDVVKNQVPDSAICFAFTDGIFDIYRDQEGLQPLPVPLGNKLRREIIADAHEGNTIISSPYKFQMGCEAMGYSVFMDDVTSLSFGALPQNSDVLLRSIKMDAPLIDKAVTEVAQWCEERNWDLEIVTKVQLVFGEKLMNLYDHAYDPRERSLERACIKLEKKSKDVELTIWDWGQQEPSMPVAMGDLDVALELKNLEFSGRGRGRLMLREICRNIERNRYGALNETCYRIPIDGTDK